MFLLPYHSENCYQRHCLVSKWASRILSLLCHPLDYTVISRFFVNSGIINILVRQWAFSGRNLLNQWKPLGVYRVLCLPFIAICSLFTLYLGVFQHVMEVSSRLTVTNNLMSLFCSISKYKDPINATVIGLSSTVGVCLCVYKFIEEDKLTSNCTFFYSVTWREKWAFQIKYVKLLWEDVIIPWWKYLYWNISTCNWWIDRYKCFDNQLVIKILRPPYRPTNKNTSKKFRSILNYL